MSLGDLCGRAQQRRRAPTPFLHALRSWVASLPWVHELAPRDRREPVRFAVECPPLGRRGVWLLFDQAAGRCFPLAIFVVVAEDLAHRGIASGWAAPISDLGDGRRLVAVASPRTVPELRALQALLLVSYATVFSHQGSADRS